MRLGFSSGSTTYRNTYQLRIRQSKILCMTQNQGFILFQTAGEAEMLVALGISWMEYKRSIQSLNDFNHKDQTLLQDIYTKRLLSTPVDLHFTLSLQTDSCLVPETKTQTTTKCLLTLRQRITSPLMDLSVQSSYPPH